MPLILYKRVLSNSQMGFYITALPADIMVFRQYLSDKNLNSVASEQSGRARWRAWMRAAGKQAGTRRRWKLLHLTDRIEPWWSLFASLYPGSSACSPSSSLFLWLTISLMLLSSLSLFSSTFSHPLVLVSQSALWGEETAASPSVWTHLTDLR